MTKAKYWALIRSALRTGMRFYPPKLEALAQAKRKYTGDNKRIKTVYECASCKELFIGKNVQVDHIKPAGKLLDYSDLSKFVETLYCDVSNLQVLCITCHKVKTNSERKSTTHKGK